MRKVATNGNKVETLPRNSDDVNLLQEFHDAQRAFPADRWRDFESCFVGAVSNCCPAEVWRAALLIAEKCMKGVVGQ